MNGWILNYCRIWECEMNFYIDLRWIGEGKILLLKGIKVLVFIYIFVDGYEVDEEEFVVGLNGIVRFKKKIMR